MQVHITYEFIALGILFKLSSAYYIIMQVLCETLCFTRLEVSHLNGAEFERIN